MSRRCPVHAAVQSPTVSFASMVARAGAQSEAQSHESTGGSVRPTPNFEARANLSRSSGPGRFRPSLWVTPIFGGTFAMLVSLFQESADSFDRPADSRDRARDLSDTEEHGEHLAPDLRRGRLGRILEHLQHELLLGGRALHEVRPLPLAPVRGDSRKAHGYVVEGRHYWQAPASVVASPARRRMPSPLH